MARFTFNRLKYQSGDVTKDTKMAKDDGLLAVIGTLVTIGAGLVTIVGFFQRIICPCDGNSLPLLGDSSLMGTRYCNKCGHNH